MKEIKLLGIGSSKHRLFRKRLEAIIRTSGFEGVKIKDVNDIDQILELGVHEIPALMINGDILAEGEPPCVTKLQYLLKVHLA